MARAHSGGAPTLAASRSIGLSLAVENREGTRAAATSLVGEAAAIAVLLARERR